MPRPWLERSALTLQLAADVCARIDHLRAFVLIEERAQPLFGAS